ncbi:MAG TPA: hypothetical protein VHZ24_13715 [Pirellulales bacterium]|nr:hypothetical protein [Pirellulales bacterium]
MLLRQRRELPPHRRDVERGLGHAFAFTRSYSSCKSVMNMQPGRCVIAISGFADIARVVAPRRNPKDRQVAELFVAAL